jgi:N-acyl amino acid synthase of PEP-CTERM/exosortase system
METVDEIGKRAAHLANFTGSVIDDAPQLLEESYRLRYQVYCLERRFLRAEDYPNGLEIDVFDRHAVHLGVLNTDGEVVATARLVQPSASGLPLFDHCSIFPEERSLHDAERRVVELSRLCMSRNYNRRAGDGFHSLQGASDRSEGPERRSGLDLVFALFKSCYQASKRRHFTHWIAAHEEALQRLMARKYGFTFRKIGPETDYYGQVTPYAMDLAEFDRVISSQWVSGLDDFLDGLEPEFRPLDDEAVALRGAE